MRREHYDSLETRNPDERNRELFGRLPDDLLLIQVFLVEPHERDHHFGQHLDAFFLHLHRSLEDGASLHRGDFRIDDAKPATAVAEHRVRLVQFLDAAGHELPCPLGLRLEGRDGSLRQFA